MDKTASVTMLIPEVETSKSIGTRESYTQDVLLVHWKKRWSNKISTVMMQIVR